MAEFKFTPLSIPEVVLVEPQVFGDSRGYFMETWSQRDFQEQLPFTFVQDNQSSSRKGVLRGLHFQKNNPQGKLVRVLSGEVFDVAVDLRRGSPTFGQWVGEKLSAANKRQLYIPENFAHGFLVLSESAEFAYKCTRFYDPADEGGLMWNDPAIGIDWPGLDMDYILSEKDQKNPLLNELECY